MTPRNRRRSACRWRFERHACGGLSTAAQSGHREDAAAQRALRGPSGCVNAQERSRGISTELLRTRIECCCLAQWHARLRALVAAGDGGRTRGVGRPSFFLFF